jgi:hypothetical protein
VFNTTDNKWIPPSCTPIIHTIRIQSSLVREINGYHSGVNEDSSIATDWCTGIRELEVPGACIIRVVLSSWARIIVSMIQTVDYKLT